MSRKPLGTGNNLWHYEVVDILSSFKYKNFRLYFFGQAISLLGIWMQGTAVCWLIWQLSSSSRWLCLVGFASQIPILIFGLFAGVLADRILRHKLIIIIQLVAMLHAALLAFFTHTGTITPMLIFLLSMFLGFIFSFDYPARQGFLMDMVGKEDIGNAVALNSSIVHAGRVLGPVAAGFIIQRFGVANCFTINAISFLFIITALLFMKRCDFFPQSISDSSESVFVSVKNGLKIVYDIVEIRKPLTVMSFLSLVIMPYAFLMPQIVNQRFSGGPQELGFAMSASGLGALIGAFYLAWRKNVNGLYKLIKYSMILAGIGLVSLAFITNLYVAIPFLILTGISSFIIVAGTNTIMQTFVPQQFRGRVMSIFTVAFFGLAPVGSLISGQIASFAGAHNTVAAGGFLAVVVMFSEIVYKKIRKS